MMDFIIVITFLGSIASIVGVFLPAQSKKQKIIHVIYGLAIVIIVSFAVHYQQKLSRINSIELSATHLINNRYEIFSNEGFIQASLAFLEKNKDLYPDSYKRAQEICQHHKCLESQYANDGTDSLNHIYGLSNAASAMAGLLRGIAEINSSSK